MILPSLKTMGLVLIVLALFTAIMPLQMPTQGGDPSTAVYRAAKGSMIPAGQAFADAASFFSIAALLAISGVILLAFSAARDWRKNNTRKSK